MRIASFDELETGSSSARRPSPGGADNDRAGKANELVGSLVTIVKKQGNIIVASGSKSKLWRDMSLKRAVQNWNVEYVGVVRNPGSAMRVTSSERLANQLRKNEMDDPKVGEIGEVQGVRTCERNNTDLLVYW